MRRVIKSEQVPEPDIFVKKLHFENNVFDMQVQTPAASAVASIFAEWFKEAGATNYCSMRMFSEELGHFEIVCQRALGKTAYDVAGERAEQLRSQKEAIQSLITEYENKPEMNELIKELKELVG